MLTTIVGPLKWIFIAIDIMFLGLFIAQAVLETKESDKVASYLRILYGVVSFLVALTFLIYASRLLSRLKQFSGNITGTHLYSFLISSFISQ